MRFGHCKTCWWWKEWFCYMWNNKTEESSYCPDHWNRKKEERKSGTLDAWIETHKGIIEKY